ncbi:MAG: tRNA pseudouridine55 synthase [Streptosporangiaceae bacterium]|nr:tRNA pseudouridine55 synthase [Streptosporangiaceae bacterium]
MSRSGLIIVDKPSGWTSHDVVARIRRLAGTRRVGHAGTLDPMATGVLVVGVEKATRLLGHLTLTDKDYLATIRLGQATDSGDAEGTITGAGPAGGLSLEAVRAGAAALTGPIQQVPPAVSAIKVGGQRSYKLAREGAPPVLPARTVTVGSFVITGARPMGELMDVDAAVTCSSGTYIRALARDLGDGLGVGGHLTMLRRTRVGPYDISAARSLEDLATAAAEPGAELGMVPLGDAAAAAFPSRSLTEPEARSLSHGARLPAVGLGPGPVAAFGPDGTLVALVTEEDGTARSLAVFVP